MLQSPLIARWRQMPGRYKAAIIGLPILLLIAGLWGSGTVDVDDVVRDKWNNIVHKPGKNNTDGAIAGGIPLRISVIGASQMLGDPDQAGVRMQLREWLVSLGNPVNYVGSNRFGNFKDNDVQAYPSKPVKILHDKAKEAIPKMQPNLIIVNAGSSDCFQEKNWGSAHALDYTRNLMDFLLDASPRAALILSTLIMSPEKNKERCIKSFNAQIRQVAYDLQREGKKVVLNEQHYDQGLPGRVTREFMKSDDMHPTFEGWEMMGELFKESIREVDAKGWFEAPVENGIMADGDAERDLEEAQKDKDKPSGAEKRGRGLPIGRRHGQF